MPVKKRKDAAAAKPKKTNPRRGSRFDDFLKQEGIYKEVVALAKKEIAVAKSRIKTKAQNAVAN
jgi:hypothetical protein